MNEQQAEQKKTVVIDLPALEILDDPGNGFGSRNAIYTVARRLMVHYQGKVLGGWNENSQQFVGKDQLGGLRERDAIYATQFAVSRGLNPFGDIHVWYIKGQIIVDIHWRILKGWAELVCPFRTKPIDMSEEEREKHGLQEGDLGVISYNIADADKDFYRAMLLTLIEGGHSVSEAKLDAIKLVAKGAGVGIVKKYEMKKDPPKGRSWNWRCRIRSLRDAIGWSHGNPTVVQIRDFAEGRGTKITAADLPVLAEPIMADLNPPEQKRYLQLNADLRKATAKRDEMPPADLAAQSQAHINLMRGSIEDEETPLGEEPDREDVINGVIEEERQPAPSVSTGSTNGAGQATVGGGFNFRTWANHLIEACPMYAQSAGEPDMVKILKGAWELGHQTITEANVADIVTALSDAAGQLAEDAPMPEAAANQIIYAQMGERI
jgi:hypothetical protein